jgi:uncharacterized membrane protein
MGTTVSPQQRSFSIRPLIFWTAALCLAFLGLKTFAHYAMRYADYSPKTYANMWPFRLWVATHIVSGTIALFIGPFQLWSGIRNRNLQVHRALGKAYLISVAIGSTAGCYLAIFDASCVSFATGAGLFFLGVAWAITTFMAYVSVRNSQIRLHREWMIRSYTVTYAFVVYRVLLETPIFTGLPYRDQSDALSWLCWAPSLLIVEMAIQWRSVTGQSG